MRYFSFQHGFLHFSKEKTLNTLSKLSYFFDNGVLHQSLNSSKVNLKPTVSNSPLIELTKAPTSNMWVPIP